jgi:hypothetical protein
MASNTLFASDLGIMKTDAVNEAGGSAYAHNDRHALAQLAATSCLNRTFYAEAESQLLKILELVKNIDNDFIAKTAIFSLVFAARKPLHRRCLVTKRVSKANETMTKPFRVGEEGR